MLHRLLIPILLSLLILPVLGQEPSNAASIEELKELSIEELLNISVDIKITKKKGEDIFQAPSTVSIIDKEMIEAYNFQSISEAINTIAGITMYRTYLKKDLPTSRGILQDNYANKVLVMINGIPSWHAITGEGNLNRISIEDVDRIEVLKGPASVQYGTNAYTGAINIVLKNESPSGIEAHFGFGSNNSYHAGANASVEQNKFKFWASGNSNETNSPPTEFIDGAREKGIVSDLIQTNNFTLNTSYKGFNALFNSYQSTEGYYGVLPGFEYGAGNNQLLNGYLLQVGGTHTLLDNKLSLSEGIYTDINNRNLSRLRNDSIRSEISGYRNGGYITAFYALSKIVSLEAGGDFDLRKALHYSNYIVNTDSILDENNLQNRTSNEYSAYVQLHIRANKLSATIGSRITQNTGYKTNLCSRLSLGYLFTTNQSLKFIYGNSYRVPSLFELYFTNPQRTVFGNKNLIPEKSDSYELVYQGWHHRFFIQLTAYYANYYQKIQRVTQESVVFNNITYYNQNVYENAGNFDAKGLEAELKYTNNAVFSGFLNYNYVIGSHGDEVNSSNHYNFKYVPYHTLTFGIEKKLFTHFAISGLYNFYSKMNAPFNEISNQQLFDLNFSFAHASDRLKYKHILSVKNIFDTQMGFPEYANRAVNEIPYGTHRMLMYSFKVTFDK